MKITNAGARNRGGNPSLSPSPTAYRSLAQQRRTPSTARDDVSHEMNPTYILLAASKLQQTCGRGSRKNWYYIRDKSLIYDPPPALSSMDGVVWRRFKSRVHFPFEMSPRENCMVGLMCIPFAVMLIIGDLWDANSDTEMPWWFLLLFVMSFVLPMAFAFYQDFQRNLPEKEAKVVSRMSQTMARQGYVVEYFNSYDCGLLRCSYVRFTPIGPNGTSSAEQSFTSRAHDEVHNLYNPQAWVPLLGTWAARTRSPDRDAVEATLAFAGIENPDTFVYKVNGTIRGRIQGNALVVQGANFVDALQNTSLANNPQVVQRMRVLQEDIGRHNVFCPLGRSMSSASFPDRDPVVYFRNTTGSRVWKVEGSKLTVFGDLEDDWLTDNDILNDCLSVENQDLQWYEFEREATEYGTENPGIV